jgi:hypothetical protein
MRWIIGTVVIVAALAGWIWLQGDKERFDVRRAHVTAAVNELTLARDAVNEEFAKSMALPKPREVPATEKHVRSIKLEADGRLVMTLAYPDWSEGDGRHVVFQPRIAGTTLEWSCRSPDLEPKYLPQSCR